MNKTNRRIASSITITSYIKEILKSFDSSEPYESVRVSRSEFYSVVRYMVLVEDITDDEFEMIHIALTDCLTSLRNGVPYDENSIWNLLKGIGLFL